MCRCQVVKNKIAFCQLHAQAESLLSACEYLRKVISTVTLATLGEENLIQEIVCRMRMMLLNGQPDR